MIQIIEVKVLKGTSKEVHVECPEWLYNNLMEGKRYKITVVD